MASTVLFQDRPPRRKVWVLNRHTTKAYEEDYRGTKISVPPGEKKELLMDRLMAEKLLSTATVPQEVMGDGREVNMGKPLYIMDLTEEEMWEHDPKTAEALGMNKRELEKETRNLCTICGETLPSVKGLTLHTKSKHPEFQPVKE